MSWMSKNCPSIREFSLPSVDWTILVQILGAVEVIFLGDCDLECSGSNSWHESHKTKIRRCGHQTRQVRRQISSKLTLNITYSQSESLCPPHTNSVVNVLGVDMLYSMHMIMSQNLLVSNWNLCRTVLELVALSRLSILNPTLLCYILATWTKSTSTTSVWPTKFYKPTRSVNFPENHDNCMDHAGMAATPWHPHRI